MRAGAETRTAIVLFRVVDHQDLGGGTLPMMPLEETAMINAGGTSQKRERPADDVRGDQIPYGSVIVGKRLFL